MKRKRRAPCAAVLTAWALTGCLTPDGTLESSSAGPGGQGGAPGDDADVAPGAAPGVRVPKPDSPGWDEDLPPGEAPGPDAAPPGEGPPDDAPPPDPEPREPPPGDAPPPEAPADAAFCPPYDESPLFRRRAARVVVGPRDDWQSAIADAAPGTEVVLRRGEYLLGDTYAVAVRDDVTVRGETDDARDVVIRGRGYGPESEGLMITGANVTIAHLSMTQIRNHAISIKPEAGARAPHLYALDLRDIGTQHVKSSMGPNGGAEAGVVACSRIGYSPGGVRGDYVNAIDVHGGVDWVIRDNYIYNIQGDGSGCEVDIDCGSYLSGPAILVWNRARGTRIERNMLVDNFRNIALGLDRGHEGGVVRNNFIFREGSGDAGIELRSANGVAVVHNTVRVGDYPGAIEFSDGRDLRFDNNLLSAPLRNRGGAQFEARGNIEDAGDGDFVSPSDPHLRAGSRAIGAGVATDGAADDIDGDARGDRRDVGADQHVE